MRVTTLLRKLLGVKHTIVEGLAIIDGSLVVDVRPMWRKPRCSGCGKRRRGYDQRRARWWRHLDFGGVRLYLRYAPRRVACGRCGVVAEKVPWSEHPGSRFTTDFEESVGYLVQRCDKTSVCEVFGVAWRTVGVIMGRVYGRHRPEDPFEGVKNIGVDEVSYRKGYRYLTLVSNHDTGRIIWAAEGKTKEALASFFKELGEERCKAIELVTMDMSEAYEVTVRGYCPGAQIVFDRFHVQRLVSDAVDETRREEWRFLREQGVEEAEAVKGLHWALLKNPWNLTAAQADRISELPRENRRLYRAYLLKESFASILDRRQPGVVEKMLERWLSWARRSRLPAFVKAASTICKHINDIVAYIRYRFTNAVAEGLNNKVRLLTRRAYGFHSADAVIAMVMLCCTGIQLSPIVKTLEI